jgi:hypothetical protein
LQKEIEKSVLAARTHIKTAAERDMSVREKIIADRAELDAKTTRLKTLRLAKQATDNSKM